jgi:polyhydroxyalkanoate synthesis repressor PhaR
MMPQRGILSLDDATSETSPQHGGSRRERKESTMVRLIKRYGSRKLYDTEESRYVLLEDIATWIRQGQEIRVIDSKSAEEVTAQTLTQIISEEGRRGTGTLPSDLLHEIIRFGTDAVNSGVRRLQDRVDKFVQSSIDRLAPVRQAREEMNVLRQRLDDLETSLLKFEVQREVKTDTEKPAPRKPAARRARTTRRPAARRSE